jgi:hypothetical protein
VTDQAAKAWANGMELVVSMVSLKFVEEQMQVLRLSLPQKTGQTSLRMTDDDDANF